METTTDEMLVIAETLGDVKARTEKLETEFSTQAKPLEAATTALAAALAGIKSLQFHVLDNNLGALSARVEEQRRAIDEQVTAIALELKKADEANAAKTGEAADALRQELAALQTQLGTLTTQFAQQIERVQLEAKREVEKFATLPGPKGEPGRSVKGAGSYDGARKYSMNEIVSFMGGSFLSNEDDNDEKPGPKAKKWTQIAARPASLGGGVTAPSTIPLSVNLGGTGLATLTSGRILIGNGTGNIATSGDGTLTGNLTVSGTGTHSFGGVLSFSQPSGHAYATGPTTAGKYLTLQSGNTTGGVNFRDSAGNEVAQYNEATDAWTFSKNLIMSARTIVATQTPASAGAAGTAGTVAWDASFIYVCTATNTWKRVGIATW